MTSALSLRGDRKGPCMPTNMQIDTNPLLQRQYAGPLTTAKISSLGIHEQHSFSRHYRYLSASSHVQPAEPIVEFELHFPILDDP